MRSRRAYIFHTATLQFTAPIFGGRPLLLLGEKKLRVGDNLKRSSDGFDYIVVITAIEPTSFRLRLNHEEITRPIKK